MKTIILMIAIMSFGIAYNQKGIETAEIKTSAQCGMCKERLEEKLNYTPGVKFAELNVETAVLTVKFKSDKISKAEILKVINDTGYDADDTKANKEAHENLPKCCQKGGHSKH
ncbi:MAG: heavy-metal-associated domain-containing protein [Crocinitomicaceae bacterium]|nr:heavy-metal-associated domain-containing protein [Crocinitomicaceae bacterium]